MGDRDSSGWYFVFSSIGILFAVVGVAGMMMQDKKTDDKTKPAGSGN